MAFLFVLLLMFSFCVLHFHTEVLVCLLTFFFWARVFEQSMAGSWEWWGTASQGDSSGAWWFL